MPGSQEGVVVWDCGATNTTVSILGTDGRMLSSRSRPTEVVATADGLSWPFEDMWQAFCDLTRAALSDVEVEPRAVVVTTFGVCWGAVNAEHELVYPVISWKCARGRDERDWAEEHLDLDEVYRQTGTPSFHFNTAFTLRWVRENRPEVFDRAAAVLLMPQLFVARLTGVRAAERTMATTTMLYDLESDGWSGEAFEAFEVPNMFPDTVGEPGEAVGTVTRGASSETGIRAGTAVCAGGHDTVIAAAGACRNLRYTVLYSTGTWNILVRTRDEATVRADDRHRNVLWQLNPHESGVLGGYNTQGHMIGGLAFDLVRRQYLPDDGAADATEKAAHVEEGSAGVSINPTFVARTGPNPDAPSAIVGWEDGLAPECAVRAVLEGLAYQTRDGIACMGDNPGDILIGGGFARNTLFGQILADVTGSVVELAGIPEVTTLGAAVLGMVGAGLVGRVEEAWERVQMSVTTLEPVNVATYADLYGRHRRLVEALGG